MAKGEDTLDTGRLGEIRSRLGANLPSDWKLTTLGETFKWGSGGTPTRTDPRYYGGDIPWLIIGDLNDGVVAESNTMITEEGLRESSAKWVEPGSVLLAMYGSIGKLGVSGRRLTTNQAIAFTKPDPVDTKYLFYYLMYTRGDLASLGKGATQKNISQTVIKAFPFVLAPLEQQKRIVAEIEKQFSRLDEAVANLKRVKANLKRYKAAVLKAAVEGKLTEAWRKQHPDAEPTSQLLQRILAEHRAKWEQAQLAKMQAKGKAPKDDAWKKKCSEPAVPNTTVLPELPAGWQWVSWETVLDFEEGAFKRGPFGSALTKAIFVETGYKVYEQYCPINDDPSFARYFVTEKKFKEMEGFAVKAGDFLISCSGVTLGRITQIPEDYEPGIINQALLRVRLNNSLIDDGYFLRLFRSPYFQKRIFDNSQGAAIPNVKGVKELKAIPIPLPPIEEQMALSSLIDEQMSIITNAMQQVDANIKRAERLGQSTLSRAFSGLTYMNERHPNKPSSNGRQC